MKLAQNRPANIEDPYGNVYIDSCKIWYQHQDPSYDEGNCHHCDRPFSSYFVHDKSISKASCHASKCCKGGNPASLVSRIMEVTTIEATSNVRKCWSCPSQNISPRKCSNTSCKSNDSCICNVFVIKKTSASAVFGLFGRAHFFRMQDKD